MKTLIKGLIVNALWLLAGLFIVFSIGNISYNFLISDKNVVLDVLFILVFIFLIMPTIGALFVFLILVYAVENSQLISDFKKPTKEKEQFKMKKTEESTCLSVLRTKYTEIQDKLVEGLTVENKKMYKDVYTLFDACMSSNIRTTEQITTFSYGYVSYMKITYPTPSLDFNSTYAYLTLKTYISEAGNLKHLATITTVKTMIGEIDNVIDVHFVQTATGLQLVISKTGKQIRIADIFDANQYEGQ